MPPQSVTGSLPPADSRSGAPTSGWTPPNEFDEFRLVRPLGRGAMGVVYLAHDRSLDRQVAVKFIAAHQPNARARARFQTEAQAIARLKQPNVVTVFRVGEVEDHPYIVSEYLVGQSLAELLLPLPWRRALNLGIGMARGLAEAHGHGVLHRDIKPANVLLTAQNEVKLLDFGLAELVEAGTLPRTDTLRTFAGTPRYMAPELFDGTSATPRSDLYALGLVLHELCTGALPRLRRGQHLSEGEQPVSGLASQPAHDEPPLTTRVPGIDPDFASIIERCLRIDPEERFASARALCAALERLERPNEADVLATGNPYRGLEPFEAEHRALFFGRDTDIRSGIERLRRQPLVLVAGDSGVGKSSLCRAGILPRVTQGALDEYRDFEVLTLTPGRRPLAALAAALAPILRQTEAGLLARLAEAPETLGPELRAVYQQQGGLLLFVDQLEELVTLGEPDQAAGFARFLGELALPAAKVRVLLSVRGDFLTRVGTLPGLGGVVERALYLLQPLTPEGVREAIIGPARSRGVVFELETLRRTLAEATAKGAGSLPLLQFALAELWERRDTVRGCITQSALDAMGGVAGALSRHADGVLAPLDRAQQQAARRLLGRLITAEGTRSERSEDELTAASEEAHTVLRALVDGRLLHTRSVGGRVVYELAHEALIASWGTLRRWLDEDVSQRALRQRIETASREWERLGQADELLWRKRQLREARELAASNLGGREQAFLAASLRAVRRQRLRLGFAALFLVLGAVSLTFWPRLREHQETQRFVRARMDAARNALSLGRGLGQRATGRRETALGLFNGQAPAGSNTRPSSADLWQRAEEVWDEALEELVSADAAFAEAEQSLGDALERVHEAPDARQLLIEVTHERILLAERFHRMNERDRLMHHFERLTAREPAWRERLHTPAEIELTTEPSGASVELMRYVDDKGLRRTEPVAELAAPGPTPITRWTLPAGSYHLRITHEGRVPVELPLLLERGGQERIRLALPATVPEGYAYVPPGCVLSGSDDPEAVRKFLRSAPLNRTCLQEGFFIGRTEVTLGNWLEYLQTLPPEAPEKRILETGRAGSVDELSLRQLPDRTWSFSLKLVSEDVLTARTGEPIRYPGRSHHQEQDWRRFPLAGVSAEDMTGYLSWLDRTGRLPGARLCNELEWTRAARGADGRRYPHGDRLPKDAANIEGTYNRRPDGFGPDEVGSHPASVSPFGVQDLAGNAFEITRPMTPDLSDIVLRGGAWYYDESGALVANRQAGTVKNRDARVGVRVCASAPSARWEASTQAR
ncbi:bifunctional serine/threonine-protein kinase/formylglycine-generating enzyme family protein [Pyxidicoccus sp. MSG2]|uniref:bifunctional serine/threonine-protein kinase/formylglycine-generating enzyme family protein n=1 Tax=Pyxidicoccus sp. MSG2 TaxID=2996790 RepID=UPI00226DCCC2|nr:bifunctional serine/threonine-protein kinase/formylglycine-generating enzyme family protein [Pyxidicoccus sp. MSG2]MCY1015906.1 bifunctional serine/threonine-protein kinase/formylglycine-generating enzyme family protein [Pyxidicoccus sp. MSG2]